MEKLILQVGQKVWCIQLGDAIVVNIDNDEEYGIMCKSLINNDTIFYTHDGKFSYDSKDVYPSLFLLNPFEPKPIQENKSELINALTNVIAIVNDTEMDKIANEKLKQLLESL